ncbi:MAG: DUF1360 domain-containing protein [Bacillota bacterium]
MPFAPSSSDLHPFDLLLLLLASFRLTHILVFDKIAEPIRERFPGHGAIAYLVRCYWCAGVWISAGLVALRVLVPAAGRWVVLIFAVAGGQAALETFLQGWTRRAPKRKPES